MSSLFMTLRKSWKRRGNQEYKKNYREERGKKKTGQKGKAG